MQHKCTCPPDEPKCGICPNNPSCKHWHPPRGNKFYRCNDRNSWGICDKPATKCSQCIHYRPSSGYAGRPRMVDEFDRMEVDNPYWNDPREYGEEPTPAEFNRDRQRRFVERKRSEDEEAFKEARKVYMRAYRAKLKQDKEQKPAKK